MNDENTRPTLIMLVLGFAAFLGVGAFYFLRTGALAMPIMPAIFGLVVLVGIVVIGAAVWQQATRDKSKRKREMDMYAIIDRLIADLNEDEANYLWRKLNAADRQETAASLTSLLEERKSKTTER